MLAQFWFLGVCLAQQYKILEDYMIFKKQFPSPAVLLDLYMWVCVSHVCFLSSLRFLPLQFDGCYGESCGKEKHSKVKSPFCIWDRNNSPASISLRPPPHMPASSTALPVQKRGWLEVYLKHHTGELISLFFTFPLCHFSMGTEGKETIEVFRWIVHSKHFWFVGGGFFPFILFACLKFVFFPYLLVGGRKSLGKGPDVEQLGFG